MTWSLAIALLCAASAIIYGLSMIRWVLAKPAGDHQMMAIADAIHEGATAMAII